MQQKRWSRYTGRAMAIGILSFSSFLSARIASGSGASGILNSGQSLAANQAITSPNGQYTLICHGNVNIVMGSYSELGSDRSCYSQLSTTYGTGDTTTQGHTITIKINSQLSWTFTLNREK